MCSPQLPIGQSHVVARFLFAGLVSGAFAVVGACTALADPPIGASGEATPSDAMPDYQDLIVLGESRPLVIRLHIETDGRGFRSAWAEYVETLADYLDGNHDGKLSAEELERAPWQRLLREPERSSTVADLLPKLNRDPNDESVTVKHWLEFVGEYAGTFEIVSAMDGATGRPSSPAGDVLLEQLDQDADGKLSHDELAAAPRVLRKFDLNDDRVIALEELAPVSVYGQPEEERTVALPSFHYYVLLPTEPMRAPADVARQLIARYDAASSANPADQRLGPDECRIDPEQFARFDADHDGRLDADELGRMLATREPDLEFTLRLGKRSPGTSRMDIVSDRTAAAPGTRGLERIADNDWVLWLDAMKLDLRVLGSTVRADAVVRFYQAHFFASDTNQNSYLEPDEARQSQVYREVFGDMDADGDEKLYPQEILDYLRHRTEVMLRRTELVVETYGDSLFEAVDADRDRRLGVRELREMAARIDEWDRDGDDLLAPSEYPRELHLTISQGRGELPGGVMVQAPEAGIPLNQRRDTNAPTWFRKMDRNRDGDLSDREFLGSSELFQRLDADRDGLVDPGEAANWRVGK